MKTNLTCSICSLLLGLSAMPGQETLAAVEVYGLATSTGARIRVEVFADIAPMPILSFSCKVLYDPANLRVVQATKNEAVWCFQDGTGRRSYLDPDTSQPGQVVIIGGRLDGRDPLGGVLGERVHLGTVLFERSTPNPLSFGVGLGRPGPYASFVGTNGAVLEAQAGAVTFSSVQPDPQDQDLDGLGDDWETQWFGGTEQAYFDQDPDRDGFDNRHEQALGSDPQNPKSNLSVRIAPHPEGVWVQWNSAPEQTYTLEISTDLRQFAPLSAGLAATPPLNSFVHRTGEVNGVAFYRVAVENLVQP